MPHAVQFLVLTVAGWVNRHQEDRLDYLREENRILREQTGWASKGGLSVPAGADSDNAGPVNRRLQTRSTSIWVRRPTSARCSAKRNMPLPSIPALTPISPITL